MDKNKRKFQRFIKQEWEDVEFKDLKIGNIFRIFDNGKRYSDPVTGNNIWIASSNPYYDLEDNELKIDTLY